MKAIIDKLKGFFIVNLGLVIALFTVAIIMTSYRGGSDYYREFKEFQGALSRSLGGDYKETKSDWVQPTPTSENYDIPLPASFADLKTNELKGWIEVAKEELEYRKKSK